jgi:hypothetical protein
VKEGQGREVLEFLRTRTVYDGGTDFGCLGILNEFNEHDNRPQLCLLFTDGFHTLNSDSKLPKFLLPLFIFASSHRANHPLLRQGKQLCGILLKEFQQENGKKEWR